MGIVPTRNPTDVTLLGGRYHLLNLLGSGGMGAVYRAYDRLTAETVALKRVVARTTQPVSSPELRLALAHEFQALASLRHPHIIAVRDYGFDVEQQPYFTMELLPNSRTIVAAGQMQSTTQKVNLLLQLLYALAYLHRRGIVHRDLKPGNILVTGRDVKVLDFGLAAVGGQKAPTSGTLLYMAPEVIRGQSAGPAADLYAVGVLGYELFAGWHPFTQTSQNLIEAILSQSPDWNFVEISPALQLVLGRLMAKTPTERYEDVTAVISALSQAMEQPLPPETAATRESFLQAAPFVGRESELEQLTSALTQARLGQGSAWLMVGESGVGKSRLLNELRIQALVQGVAVLRGQTSSDGGGAFHLWHDTLRWLALLAAPDNLETAVLHPLVPDIPQLLQRDVVQIPSLSPEQARKRLFSTITTLLRRAAKQQPLLLLLEDIHRADEDSLEMLQWLERQIEQLPILLVVSYRRGERPQLSQQFPEMRQMTIGRLASESVAALTEAMLGLAGRRPHLVTFLQQETEGNTFFLVEVMRALAEEAGQLDRIAEMTLPTHVFAGGIKQAIQRRLQRIPPVYRPLMQVAAVAGRQLDLTILKALTAVDVEEWLTVGANSAVLEVQDGRWQFAHDKLREGILTELDTNQKQTLHRQVAQTIEQVYTAQLAPYYADLAYHYGQSQERSQERYYLKRAGEAAQATYANAVAINFYGQLLPLLDALLEKIDTLLQLGSIFKLVGQWTEAETHYRQAYELSLQTADEEMKARCLHAMGNLMRSHGNYPEALNWLKEAYERFETANQKAKASESVIEMGLIFYQKGEYATARSYLEKSLWLAQQSGDETSVALALHTLGGVAYSQGNYAEAQTCFEQGLAVRERLNDKSGMAHSFNNLGNIAYVQGDYETASVYYEKSLTLRREIGDKWAIAASLNNLGIIPYQQGDYAKAKRLWEESLEIRRELADKWSMPHALDNLGLVAHGEGDYAKARQLYEESLAIRRESGDKQGIAITLGNLGHVELDQGEYTSAQPHYQESLRLAQEIDDKRGVVYALLGLAGVMVGWKLDREAERAVRLTAVAKTLLDTIGARMERDEQRLYDHILAACQVALDSARFEAAWAEGQTMNLNDTIAEVIPPE